jgi:hypothetical protein
LAQAQDVGAQQHAEDAAGEGERRAFSGARSSAVTTVTSAGRSGMAMPRPAPGG